MKYTQCGAAHLLFLVGLIAAASCGGDASGPAPAGPPSAIAVVSGNAQAGESGVALPTPLSVKVTDLKGTPVGSALVTFTITAGGGSLSQTLDTTDAGGTASTVWTMGPELGEARMEARVQGLTVPAVFTATVKAGAPVSVVRVSNVVGSSAGGFDLDDSVAIKVVDKFDHPIADAQVTFNVTAGGGTVSAASKATGSDGIARTAWKLGPSGTQTLRAAAGPLTIDISGVATSCAETTMAVGDVVSLSPATGNMCLVTNGTGTQKYLVSVTNTSNTPASAASYRIRGAGGGTVSNTAAPIATASSRTFGLSREYLAAVEEAKKEARTHAKLLQANLDLIAQLNSPRRAQLNSRPVASLMQQAPVPNVGDTLDVKIPSIDNLCSVQQASRIRARVVYVGTRAIILEDIDSIGAPLAGKMDDRYRAVGQEFDNVMFPILTANYGNPLAYDAQTDNNGHIFMVFSKVVNAAGGGSLAGFVTSGDFYNAVSCGASNFGEYFYARVPTSTAAGFGSGTVEDWARRTRTVIIHEVKHVTSFAEKFASPNVISSGFFARDQWLEESSAMMAEELWARTIFGYAPKTNVDYASSVYCEVRPTPNAKWPQCQPTKPLSMFDHFIFLYDYVSKPDALSAIGRVSSSDFTFYGSGWMFLRWIIDTYAASESGFLKSITNETALPGTDAIEARTGRPLSELLSDFALALALDDYPGFAPKDPKHALTSWNTRDIFAGMSGDFSSQGFFTNPNPLKTARNSFGRFVLDVANVPGGGFSVTEVSGIPTAKQLFEFKGASGAGFPSEMRVQIVRIQ